MKIKGVVVDAMIKEEVLKISPSIIWDDYYNGINFDSFDEFDGCAPQLKNQLMVAYINLEISGEDLKN